MAVVAVCAATLVGGSAIAAPASSKGVATIADPASGLQIHLEQGRTGGFAFEVGDRDVRVRREFTPGRLQTVVTTSAEKVSFVVDERGLAISTARGSVRVSPTDPSTGRRAKQLLDHSRALGLASALLLRVQLPRTSPLGHTLMVTRAFLLSMAGRQEEALPIVQGIRETLQGVRVVRAGFGGPDECWNEYAREAIAAYKELEDCMKHVAWYDIVGGVACTSIYDLRAIGAFSWYLSCVGLSGVRS